MLESCQPDYVMDRFVEAADCLRRLPGGYKKAKLTSWPDVVQSTAEAYGYNPVRSRPGAPSPAAISRMDECLLWLFDLTAEERKIIWARACKISWRRLEDMDGRSHVTLRKVYKGALGKVCALYA